MAYKARKQLMAWMETDYSKHTRFLKRRKMEDKMTAWAHYSYGRDGPSIRVADLFACSTQCSEADLFYMLLCILYKIVYYMSLLFPPRDL